MNAIGVPGPGRLLPNTAAGACYPRAALLPAMVLRAVVLGAVLLGAVLLAAGCAGTGRSNGVRLLERGEYAAAVEALRAEAALRPEDPLVQRDLGVALLESGQASEAAGILRRVRAALPRDSGVAFQLGRACEGSGDLGGALDAYRDYLALGGRGKDEVAARLQAITRRKIETEMRALLAREDSLATVEIPQNAVAVADFANPAATDSLTALGRGLAALLITDLSRVDALRVVERARMRVLLDELDLTRGPASAPPEPELPDIGTIAGVRARLRQLPRPDGNTPYLQVTGADDDPAFQEALRAFQSDQGLAADGKVGPRTRQALAAAWAGRPPTSRAGGPAPVLTTALAPRVGHLLGARRFVQGSFLLLPDARVQLDAGIMGIDGGIVNRAGEPVQGRLPEILHLEKTLGIAIIEALGVKVDAAIRKALGEPATNDFQALLSFSHGLVLEDQGRIDEAAAQYRLAVERSPSFAVAAERLRITSVGSADQKNLDRREAGNLRRTTTLSPDAAERQVGALGLGPLPDGGEGSPKIPKPNDVVIPDPTVRMVIEGDIPEGNR